MKNIAMLAVFVLTLAAKADYWMTFCKTPGWQQHSQVGYVKPDADGFVTIKAGPLTVVVYKTQAGVVHEDAYQLLEMMMTLRPRLVEKLLSACSSVKVKRLFFLLADDLNPPWWERVRKEEIDLGAGCRVIDKDGSFNSKYNLVVKPWREI